MAGGWLIGVLLEVPGEPAPFAHHPRAVEKTLVDAGEEDLDSVHEELARTRESLSLDALSLNPLGDAEAYGDDRVFLHLRNADELMAKIKALS